MTRWLGALCICALILSTVAPAAAQQPTRPGPPPGDGQGQQMPMHGGGMMGGGMMMCPMMGGGMMGGRTPMMGGDLMGEGGMMGMMGGQADPKTMGRMLQMRGEIMKAVGDVLIKHGRALEAQPAK